MDLHDSVFIFACVAIFAGVLLGILLGRGGGRRPGCMGVIFLAGAGVVLGGGLSLATGIAHGACSDAGICAGTSDTTVWALAFPIIFIPAYWIAMAFGAFLTDPPEGPVTADAATIASALEKFRSGQPITEVCPACETVLVVKAVRSKEDGGIRAHRLTCKCGNSNGTYSAA